MKNEITIYKKPSMDVELQETAWEALALNSQKAYSYDFKLFFDIIKKTPENIEAKDILKFINHLRENNYKNSSINRKVASLSKMFKVLQTSGKIKVNPVDTLKQFKKINMPVEKEIKISLTMQDVKTAIKKEQGMTIPDKKMILIIRALVKTGLRISELLHIKNKDIEKAYDLLNSKIRIVGKGRKERFIFLDNKFLKDIEKIWPKTKETDYLLYTRNDDCYDRRNVGIELTAFFKRKINKHVHPHSLRHVFATHKINVEKQDIHAVSRYLGHASVSTTLSAYIDTALDIKTSRIKI